MRIIISILILISCNKSTGKLISRYKINEHYWKYIIEDNDKDLKKYIETNSNNIDIDMNEGEISITLAAKCNSLKVVELLIEKKADVNAKNSKGQTALILALLEDKKGISEKLKKYKIVGELLSKGADPNLPYGLSRNNALMLAIIKGDLPLISVILESNVDINYKNLFGQTALIMTIKSDMKDDIKLKIVNKLLEFNGIDINVKDKDGKSALAHAVIKNNTGIVSLLIQRSEINVNILDKENMTPFDYLNFDNFEIELALSLLKSGAKFNNEKYFYDKAQKEYLLDIIDLLIESRGDINYIKENKNLLHWSIILFNSNIDISIKLARFLISKMNLDSNSLESYFRYAKERDSELFPLISFSFDEGKKCTLETSEELKKVHNLMFKAVKKGSKKTIQILLQKGANINEKNSFGNTVLIEAIGKGHKEIVELLIEKGANVDEKNNFGSIALVEAAGKGYKEIVELLLRRSTTINRKDNFVNIALIEAVERGNKEIVKLLLEKGANINEKNSLGNTALTEAMGKCSKKVVELFVSKGLNISNENNYNSISLRMPKNEQKEMIEFLLKKVANISDNNDNEFTVLMVASKKGHQEIVKMLLKEGANINGINISGSTALMIASQNGHKEVVKILLEEGANINVSNSNGFTALMMSSSKGHKKIVKLLLEKGANINDKNNSGWTALMIASQKGHIKVVKLLLEKGANVNYKNSEGYTAIMIASIRGHVEIVKLLLEKEANINESCIALTLVSQNDNKFLAELSLKNKVNINEKNNFCATSLTKAIKESYRQIMEMLLKKEMEVNIKDEDERTALMYAAAWCNKDIVELLLEKGLDINAKDKKGNTILTLAVKSCNKNIVKFLLQKGANINHKDKSRRTILEIACRQNCKEIMKSILKEEIKINYNNNNGFALISLARELNFKDVYFKTPIFNILIEEIIIDYEILYKSLERRYDIENKESLKEEINKNILLLKLLITLPLELFELIIRFI